MWTEYQYVPSDDFVQLLIVCEQVEDTGLQAVDDFEEEDSAEAAEEEQPKGGIKFIYKVTIVIMSCKLVPTKKQITLAVIKPDAVQAGLVDEIIEKVMTCIRQVHTIMCSLLQFKESGMEVLHREERVLSKEEAAEFYKQHEGSVRCHAFPNS